MQQTQKEPVRDGALFMWHATAVLLTSPLGTLKWTCPSPRNRSAGLEVDASSSGAWALESCINSKQELSAV